MYSKQEASLLRQQFWTAFGKYMSPIPSAEGISINWVNYKTGVRHIRFVMDAGKDAMIGIELSHPSPEEKDEAWTKMLTLKTEMEMLVEEEWVWQNAGDEKPAGIYAILPNVNILDRNNWPAIISFLKPRLILLDHFWVNNKFVFE